MHYRYLAQHEEENRRHQQRLKYWTDPADQPTETPAASAPQSNLSNGPSGPKSAPRSAINTALFNLLNDFRKGRIDEATGYQSPPPSPTPPPSGIDWSSSVLQNFGFDPSFAEQAVLNLAGRFAQYNVDEGALGAESDDDLQEDEGDRDGHGETEDVPGTHLH